MFNMIFGYNGRSKRETAIYLLAPNSKLRNIVFILSLKTSDKNWTPMSSHSMKSKNKWAFKKILTDYLIS